MTEADLNPKALERIATVLLVAVAVLVVAVGVTGWGWWKAATTPITAADLDAIDRQRLIQEMVDQSPGVFRWTFFEPRIGYTLRPDAEIDLFDETFISNALGMRSGPVAKAPDVFRVLVVGDSWAYGMGVGYDEAFPQQLEALANEHAGVEQPIECATLALPGWNAINQVAALETYVDLLDPDAVVFAPTTNDHHSMGRVLPNGSIWWGGVMGDFFGDPHTVTYPGPFVDTYRSRARWLHSFGEWRRAERRLAERGVPTAFFFVARWYEAFVHIAAHHAELESRYLVMPRRYTLGKWSNPPPYRHASPAGHQLYARSLYRLLAEPLGWQPLPVEAVDDEIRLFETVPSGPALDQYGEDLNALFAVANGQIPTAFAPGRESPQQNAGPIDLRSGLIGRATTILVRRQPETRALRVVVQRLQQGGALYPLELTVRIPSSAGGTRVVRSIRAEGRPRVRFTIPIPKDLPDDAVLDVIFETAGARALEQAEVVRALRLVEITPVD